MRGCLTPKRSVPAGISYAGGASVAVGAVAAAALALVGCGAAPPPAGTPARTPAPMSPAGAAAPDTRDVSFADAHAPGPSAPETATPHVDPFANGVAEIKRIVPSWDNGTGVAVRYLKVATGKRLAMLYVDTTPPEWKADAKAWLIVSRSKLDGETVSTVAITLNRLKSGHFEGAPSKHDCMIGAAIGTDEWDPNAQETAWSNNPAGFCDVELREASQPGHFEGSFKAKLVSKNGTFYTIDQGYLYINR